MQRTLAQLTTMVERELSQYAGAGVQLYAEGIIQQRIQQAFDYVFTLKYWPQSLVREQRTLNGLGAGTVTSPFTAIKQWDDIRYIFREFSDRPIPELPMGQSSLNIVGTQPIWVTPRDDTFLFTVIPATATGNIEVVGRNRPANPFVADDIVPFDDWAIIHYAAWSYLVDDASNPAAIDKEQGLFDVRLKLLEEQADKGVVYLNPRNANDIPQRWF